jgi:hypothetical protein
MTFAAVLSQDVTDRKATLTDKFMLSLGQTPRLDISTGMDKAAYKTDVGDPYLEGTCWQVVGEVPACKFTGQMGKHKQEFLGRR